MSTVKGILAIAFTFLVLSGQNPTLAVDGGADGSGHGQFEYRPCSRAELVGEFSVVLAESYTGIQGTVYDGVVPFQIPEEALVEGECRLLRARSLQCDPPCQPGETCGEDGNCIPYPEARSV